MEPEFLENIENCFNSKSLQVFEAAAQTCALMLHLSPGTAPSSSSCLCVGAAGGDTESSWPRRKVSGGKQAAPAGPRQRHVRPWAPRQAPPAENPGRQGLQPGVLGGGGGGDTVILLSAMGKTLLGSPFIFKISHSSAATSPRPLSLHELLGHALQFRRHEGRMTHWDLTCGNLRWL